MRVIISPADAIIGKQLFTQIPWTDITYNHNDVHVSGGLVWILICASFYPYFRELLQDKK